MARSNGPRARSEPLRPDREQGRAPALPLHPWDLRCLHRDHPPPPSASAASTRRLELALRPRVARISTISCRVILAGYAISHEPAALGWHVHRRDEESLRERVFGYGSGLSAYAFKQLLGRRTALDVVRRLPRSLHRVGHLGGSTARVPSLPLGLWAGHRAACPRPPEPAARQPPAAKLGSRCGSQ